MDDRNAPATKGDIQDLRSEMNGKFEKIDAKFEQMDGKFEKIDEKFEKIDGKFEKIDAKFEQMDEKFELLRSEMNHAYRDLVERIDDTQTQLLRAFYDFA
jgi:archaellum component FlaC